MRAASRLVSTLGFELESHTNKRRDEFLSGTHECFPARRPGKDRNENKGLACGGILDCRGCARHIVFSRRPDRNRGGGPGLAATTPAQHPGASGFFPAPLATTTAPCPSA